MKYFLTILLFLNYLAIGFAQESANYGAPKFAPENGKKLLIMGQDLGSVGGLNTYTNGYVDYFTSHIPAGITSYTSIESLGGLLTKANWGAGDIHAQAYANDPTFDHSCIAIALYLVGILDEIVSGAKDANIRTLANWIKVQNKPVFLRIGYEFEGPWNNYAPNAFKNAWRHIVHVFDEQQVRNVAYVWQSAGLNYSNIMNWYPGDEYVNWFGYSQFDGQNMGRSIKNLAAQRNKPVMIAEATPKVNLSDGNGQVHWNSWYNRVFNDIYSDNNIKAFAYINADWDSQSMWIGQGWGDSRVQIDAYVKEQWELEMLKTPWLHASEDLFDALNYEDWIATSTSEVSPTKQEKLNILSTRQNLQIKRKNNQPMDGLHIWDVNGRLLHQDSTSQSQYDIELSQSNLQTIIVNVKINHQLISEKIILQ